MKIKNIDKIAYVAGTVIAVSAIPQIWDCLFFPEHAAAQSIIRNAMLVFGNSLWVYYGIKADLKTLRIMCGVGAVLNGIVLGAAIKAQWFTAL